MSWRRFRIATIAGALLAAMPLGSRADDCCESGASCAPSYPGRSCQTIRYGTMCVTEWVPETYQVTRTAYRTEYRQENYTTYRMEMVPEVRTRTVTVNRVVPEVRTETRNVCVTVPTVEERTVMETFVTSKPVTRMVQRCEDHGHFETCEVPCETAVAGCATVACGSHRGGLFHRRRACAETCSVPCAPAECSVPATRTVQTWVSCPVTVQVPVTTCEQIVEQRPVTQRVTVYKNVIKQESFQVTSYRCVAEARTESFTVMVPRQVAVPATRTVAICVPYQEVVTLTRMVPRVVEKLVPIIESCGLAPEGGCDGPDMAYGGGGHGCGHRLRRCR